MYVKELKNKIDVLSMVSTRRVIQPGLSCIAFYTDMMGGHLRTTDGTHFIETLVPLSGHVVPGGDMVPGTLLKKAVAAFKKGEIDLSYQKHDGSHFLRLEAGSKTTAEIQGKTDWQHPNMPCCNTTGKKITLDPKAFFAAITRIYTCAAGNESNNVLGGIGFTYNKNSLEMAATDGSRLSFEAITDKSLVRTAAIKEEGKFVLDGLAIRILLKISKIWKSYADTDKIVIYLDTGFESYTRIKCGEYDLVLRKMESDYPKYRQLVPNTDEVAHVYQINRLELLEALQMALPFTNPRTYICKLNFNNLFELKVSAQNVYSDEYCSFVRDVDLGEKKFPEDETDISLAFNVNYLINALKQIKGEDVSICFDKLLSPCVLYGEDESYRHLVMPVQTK